MAECDLPKVNTRVRFPPGALVVKKPHKHAVLFCHDTKIIPLSFYHCLSACFNQKKRYPKQDILYSDEYGIRTRECRRERAVC